MIAFSTASAPVLTMKWRGVPAGATRFSSAFSRSDSVPGVGSSPDFMQGVFSASEKAPPAMARTSNGKITPLCPNDA